MKYRVGDVLRGNHDRRHYTVVRVETDRVFIRLRGSSNFDYPPSQIDEHWTLVARAPPPERERKGFAKFIHSVEGSTRQRITDNPRSAEDIHD